MPAASAVEPRTMLPPPTTTAICTPRSSTSTSWRATPSMRSKPSPKPVAESANASPESFSSTRSYCGLPSPASAGGPSPAITNATVPPVPRPPGVAGLGPLPHLEAGEAAQHELLAHLGRVVVQQVLDGLLVVADVRLVEQHDLLVEAVELALDDLLHDVGRLALGLGGVDLALLLEHVVGHVLAAQVRRVGDGDVQGDLVGESLELVGLGDEVGLAVELDEHAELGGQVRVRGVQVGVDDALGGAVAGPLLDAGLAGLAQDLLGPLEVAVGVLQRLLAVHHPCPGGVAEGLDLGGRDLHSVVLLTGWSDVVSQDLGWRCLVRGSAALAASSAGVVASSSVGSPSAVAASSSAAVCPSGAAAEPLPASAAPEPLPASEAPSADSSSSRSHSASGSSSAGLAAIGVAPSLPAASEAYTLRSRRPSATASATMRVSRLPARMASSLPGIG